MTKLKNMKVALAGCGYTRPTRHLEKPETDLGVEAVLMAAEDAGIDPAHIDGINVQVHHYPPPDTGTIIQGIGMEHVRWQREGGRGIPSAALAAEAIDRGECNTVAIVKIMNTIAPVLTPQIDPQSGGVAGPAQFEVPYGLGYTMQRTGLIARRYMHRFGATKEQLGWIPVVQREHALLNPWAVMKTSLTLDDYLNCRLIAEPVRLLDCDMPVNCAFAFLVTRGDIARDLRHRPVYLKAWSSAGIRTPDHLIPERLGGMLPMAEELYRDAGIGPDELDVWYIYDGFTYFVPLWLEDLGLVPRGETANFVEGGANIRINGPHPLNTHGGQLSEGRLHGTGHVLEAIQQLRGTAGPRQVPDASAVIVASGQLGTGGAGILSIE